MAITAGLPMAAARERLAPIDGDSNSMRRYAQNQARLDEIAANRVLGMVQLRNELAAKRVAPDRHLFADDISRYSGWALLEKVFDEPAGGLVYRRSRIVPRIAGLLLSNDGQLVEYRGTYAQDPVNNHHNFEDLLGFRTRRAAFQSANGRVETDHISVISLAASPDDVDPQLSHFTRSYKIEDVFAGLAFRHSLEVAESAQV